MKNKITADGAQGERLRPPPAHAASPQGVEFAPDSPLEGDGFELPVPVRQAKLTRFCR
jgi:hypothetical protein